MRDRRLESRPNPQTRISALRSAGFPACGFWGHSCPHFQELRPHPLLITPVRWGTRLWSKTQPQRMGNLESLSTCLTRTFHTLFRISLAPRLQPGEKREETNANRFNGLPSHTKAVETAWTSPSLFITGLKPRC